MAAVFRFSEMPSEIQLLVFEQFDKPTLHSAVQVNKRWHDMSADLLWKEPSISQIIHLAFLRSLQRRQYYASKIRGLQIRMLTITRFFDSLAFSSLRCLFLNGGADILRPAIHLVPYLGPKIRTLGFRGCELDSRSLDMIACWCPNLARMALSGPLVTVDDFKFAFFIESLSSLRELCLDGMFDVSAAMAMFEINAKSLAPKLERLDLLNLLDFPDPEPFRMFMMSCRSLQYLSIENCQRNRPLGLMTGSVLAHVLKTNPLQHLVGDWLSPGLLEQIPVSSTSVPAFGELKSLKKSGCSSSALTILQQASSRLQHLELRVYDVTTHLFSFMRSQVQLRYLAITPYTHDEVLSITHLLALSSLTSLVHLEITYRCRNVRFPVVHGLNDRRFSRLVSGFSQLMTLVLNLERPDLSARSIRSLSQACPSLKRCALLYDHDLSTWYPLQTASDLWFPNVVSLYLGSVLDVRGGMQFDFEDDLDRPAISMGRDWLAGEIAGLRLLNYIPRLERFGMETTTETGSVVKDVLVTTGPCRRLTDVPITIVEGKFSHDDFMSYP